MALVALVVEPGALVGLAGALELGELAVLVGPLELVVAAPVVAAALVAAVQHEHGFEVSGPELVLVPREFPWLSEPSFLGPLGIAEGADQLAVVDEPCKSQALIFYSGAKTIIG